MNPIQRVAVMSSRSAKLHALLDCCGSALPQAQIRPFGTLTDLVYGLAADAVDIAVLDSADLSCQGSAVPVVLRGMAPGVRLAVVQDAARDLCSAPGIDTLDLDELDDWLTGASLPGRLW